MVKNKEYIKEIVEYSFLAIILYVQEQLLLFLPNIQLTVMLIVLYSKVYGLKKTTYIILIYVILDCVTMGSLNIFYTPFMFIGWEMIPLLLNTIFKNINNIIGLAFVGSFTSLLYCWIYIIPVVLLTEISIKNYLSSDVFFELLIAASSFLSILWLYEPCYKAIKKLLKIR